MSRKPVLLRASAITFGYVGLDLILKNKFITKNTIIFSIKIFMIASIFILIYNKNIDKKNRFN